METRRVGVFGSRKFSNYLQLKQVLDVELKEDDLIISGGARGADSMAQRYAKETGHDILIKYPKYHRYGTGATFVRNEKAVESCDHVLAFYAKGSFQDGGTFNTITWCRKLNVAFKEFEET